MSAQTSTIELLTDLTEAQQETLVGGKFADPNNSAQFLFPHNFAGNFSLSITSFFAKKLTLNTFSASGPNGSVAGGSYTLEIVRTFGVNVVGIV